MGTVLLIWIFLMWVLDMDGFLAFALAVVISLALGVSDNKLSMDTIVTSLSPDTIEKPKPKPKAIPITNIKDVKPEYINNSKRSNEPVEIFKVNGEKQVCVASLECFKPVFRKHLDGVLYACSTNMCYTVKEN